MMTFNPSVPWKGLLCASALVLGLAGCSAHAGVGVRARTVTYAHVEGPHVEGPHVVFAEPPTLVSIGPDVWVVENYDREVFFVGGFYWVNHGGFWYRSRSYAEGWARAEVHVVPTAIVRVRTDTYVSYRRPPGAIVRRVEARPSVNRPAPPGHRDPPGVRRGHRKVDPAHLGDVESRGNDKSRGRGKHPHNKHHD